MTNDVTFEYRIPLTYVRITGSCTTTTDELAEGATPTVECRSVVTTETGADMLSRYTVQISPGDLDKQKSTWNLLPDGRLTGADVTNTVDRFAVLKAALSAGGTVLGVAGPPLLAMGPPGWIALAGAATLAAAGTAAVAAGGVSAMSGETLQISENQPTSLATEMQVKPEDWDVHERYAAEKPDAAQVLAGYRAVLAEATAAHQRAVWEAVRASDPSAQQRWAERVASLDRIVRSTSRPAALAETAYATWKASKVTMATVNHDERLRIDELPGAAALDAWLEDTSTKSEAWMPLARRTRVAVTVELQEIRGNNRQEQQDAEEPFATDNRVRFRQPRPAVLETWKLSSKDGVVFTKERQSVQYVSVAYPGNEAWLTLRPGSKTTSAIAATFSDGGALTKVTTDLTAPALQRAQGVTDLVSALGTGAETGNDLRTAMSPPSLVTQAAEAKAARELGLVPTKEDPLKELKSQLAEQELRTRIKLAEQLASATSPPVTVSVSYPVGG